MTEVISVRFRNGCKEYYFDPKGLTVPTDTDVIVETAQGPEFARCSQGNHQVEDNAVVKPLRGLIRIATDNDRHTAAYNRGREKEAFEVCKKKIQQHKLEMKLVRVECSFDGSKILFALLPDRIYYQYLRYERFFILAVVLLAWMGVFSVPLSFCMEGIVRGLCAVTAFPFQLAQYYFF